MYAGKTCGLCGNYNGNKGDDFRTAAGLVEPLVERFGNAWKLRGDCEDLQRQHGDPCQLNPRLSTWRWGEGSTGGAALRSPTFQRTPRDRAPTLKGGGRGAWFLPPAFDYLHLGHLVFKVAFLSTPPWAKAWERKE